MRSDRRRSTCCWIRRVALGRALVSRLYRRAGGERRAPRPPTTEYREAGAVLRSFRPHQADAPVPKQCEERRYVSWRCLRMRCCQRGVGRRSQAGHHGDRVEGGTRSWTGSANANLIPASFRYHWHAFMAIPPDAQIDESRVASSPPIDAAPSPLNPQYRERRYPTIS